MNERFNEHESPSENATESLRECGPDIAVLENLLTHFEAKHDLGALHDITKLTPEEAPQHPLREPARKDLIPIVSHLGTLKKETNITESALAILRARYMTLSRAVGIISKGVVDHTR